MDQYDGSAGTMSYGADGYGNYPMQYSYPSQYGYPMRYGYPVYPGNGVSPYMYGRNPYSMGYGYEGYPMRSDDNASDDRLWFGGPFGRPFFNFGFPFGFPFGFGRPFSFFPFFFI